MRLQRSMPAPLARRESSVKDLFGARLQEVSSALSPLPCQDWCDGMSAGAYLQLAHILMTCWWPRVRGVSKVCRPGAGRDNVSMMCPVKVKVR